MLCKHLLCNIQCSSRVCKIRNHSHRLQCPPWPCCWLIVEADSSICTFCLSERSFCIGLQEKQCCYVTSMAWSGCLPCLQFSMILSILSTIHLLTSTSRVSILQPRIEPADLISLFSFFASLTPKLLPQMITAKNIVLYCNLAFSLVLIEVFCVILY